MKSLQADPPNVALVVGTNSTFEEIFQHLQGATHAHTAATSAAETAQHVFFESGTEADERTLEAARDSERKAANHLARAQHLMKFAEARRVAEERAELEQKLAALEAEAEGDERTATALIEEEVQGYESIVAILDRRLANNQAIAQRQAKIASISTALGRPHFFDPSMFEIMPLHWRVAQRLQARTVGLHADNPRARWFMQLAEGTRGVNYHPADPQHPLRVAAGTEKRK